MSTHPTCRFAALVLLAVAPLSTLAAQAIRGRVLLPDSTTAVAGATITARDPRGAAVTQATTGPSGRFALTLPGPGNYQLSAIRIGYRPATISVSEIERGESRDIALLMHEQPYTLAEIAVTAQDRCRMSQSERVRLVELWERARGALGRHVSATGFTMAHVMTIAGTEDGPQRLPNGELIWNSNNRYPEVDSLGARETWTASFLARTPPEVLLARGYAHADHTGAVEYDVPNPDVVLSEGFLARYCFRLDGGPAGQPHWVGLRFQPLEGLDSLTDVAGTLWLDPVSARIQRLEFEYRHLPRIPFANCTSSNRPQRTPYGERRYGPYCHEYLNRGAVRLPRPPSGTGGTLQFANIGANEWMLVNWVLRTPGQEFMDRYAGYGTRVVGSVAERCHDRPPACLRVLVAVPRLIVTTGALATLTRDGVEIYRSASAHAALERVAALQARPGSGQVVGRVTDMHGGPVVNAVISTDFPARAALTDSTGRFEFRTLPARELAFEVVREGFQPLGFRLQVLADSTRRTQVELAPPPPGSVTVPRTR